jgi:hypothetical protein
MPSLRVLASSLVGLLLVACTIQPVPPSGTTLPSPTSRPSPSGSGSSLLTIETRGGECPQGPCGSIVTVEGDGRLHQLIPTDIVLATIPPTLVDALRVEIERADYTVIESRKFSGQCPTANDGQETIYTFHAPDGDERIASCEVVIDANDPLFHAVAGVLAALP